MLSLKEREAAQRELDGLTFRRQRLLKPKVVTSVADLARNIAHDTPQLAKVEEKIKELTEMLAHDAGNEEKIRRWLSDPTTWVGVGENQELYSGPGGTGTRVGLSYDISQWDQAIIGKSAVSHWKYLLIAKCKTADTALHILRHGDLKTAPLKEGEEIIQR